MPNSIQIGRTDNDLAAITGVGTAQTGSPLLTARVNVLTSTAGQTAAVLPTFAAGDVIVRVTGGTAATIFPPVGGAINGGSVNAASSLASGAVAVFVPHPNGIDYTRVG